MAKSIFLKFQLLHNWKASLNSFAHYSQRFSLSIPCSELLLCLHSCCTFDIPLGSGPSKSIPSTPSSKHFARMEDLSRVLHKRSEFTIQCLHPPTCEYLSIIQRIQNYQILKGEANMPDVQVAVCFFF